MPPSAADTNMYYIITPWHGCASQQDTNKASELLINTLVHGAFNAGKFCGMFCIGPWNGRGVHLSCPASLCQGFLIFPTSYHTAWRHGITERCIVLSANCVSNYIFIWLQCSWLPFVPAPVCGSICASLFDMCIYKLHLTHVSSRNAFGDWRNFVKVACWNDKWHYTGYKHRHIKFKEAYILANCYSCVSLCQPMRVTVNNKVSGPKTPLAHS